MLRHYKDKELGEKKRRAEIRRWMRCGGRRNLRALAEADRLNACPTNCFQLRTGDGKLSTSWTS